MPKNLVLASGYDRRKSPPKSKYRRMTVAEARKLKPGETVPFEASDGTAREVRINGRVQTWKREPHRIEVPVKYGMYECARLKVDTEHPTSELSEDSPMEALLVLIEGPGVVR